ncbi:unnamed protein product [Lactuca saligna]|uniref:HSF-type DNA-binding domain-containing protein n=1 Tax=Lactuca saligna TaxID=75948 RepID=A0AA35VBE8_LACSI|nr:unnamed protein product [Lactuca saligna]
MDHRPYKRSLSSSSYRPHGSHPLRFENAVVDIDEGDVHHLPQPLDCLIGTPIPPFLSKTYDLVDDPRLNQIISWSDNGASFIVWDPVEFARGFRKIDTDRWEFACESFLKGKRHLLKNIKRRKSQQTEEWNSNSSSIENEVERLQKEKMEMMQEVMKLQQQQRGTHEYMESVNEMLQAAENRQKLMISSLAKAFKIPTLLRNHISSQRRVRKFVKHQSHDQDLGFDPIPVDDNVRNPDSDSGLKSIDLHELGQPKDLTKENNVVLDDCVVKQEDIWSLDFETIAGITHSNDWNDVGIPHSDELAEFGSGDFSDFWDLSASGGEHGETSKNQYGF